MLDFCLPGKFCNHHTTQICITLVVKCACVYWLLRATWPFETDVFTILGCCINPGSLLIHFRSFVPYQRRPNSFFSSFDSCVRLVPIVGNDQVKELSVDTVTRLPFERTAEADTRCHPSTWASRGRRHSRIEIALTSYTNHATPAHIFASKENIRSSRNNDMFSHVKIHCMNLVRISLNLCPRAYVFVIQYRYQGEDSIK